jgi:nicotinate-nucleotide adenylyltransferase
VIGVLGGTFDPIHHGHLRTALDVMQALRLEQVRFVPVRRPPHRDAPRASAADRLAMVRVALGGQPGFLVDDRELRRSGTSYMVDTLASLRAELGDTPIGLLLGDDAFRWFATWHQWQRIPDLAHIIVMQRPGSEPPEAPELETLISDRSVSDASLLETQPHGCLWFQPVTQLGISSTRIRELLRRGLSPRYLLPDAVLEILRDSGIYRGC